MQPTKIIKKKTEFEVFENNSEKLTSSLTDVMNKFELKRQVAIFDFIKTKGLAISSLVSILVILPFLGFASINSLVKSGLKHLAIESGKDAYYDVKNNEFIDWRRLLFLHIKRFVYLINRNIHLKKEGKTALIFDDSKLEKTGKSIELVGMVHDHTNPPMFVLGYKLLVCGFWDGGSFIPIDFSLHREKGNKHLIFIKECKRLDKQEAQQVKFMSVLQKRLTKQAGRFTKNELKYKNKPTKTNQKYYENSKKRYQEMDKRYNDGKNEISRIKFDKEKADKRLKRFYNNGKLYGLSTKERTRQYKKKAQDGSFGKSRRTEADQSKIAVMLNMISRAVKHGIIPDYVMTDSWFFCFELLYKLDRVKKGAIKLISMVKLNNQKFTLCETGKEMSVKNILKIKNRKPSRSKKMKAKYIKVPCYYNGIRTNLFYVKMGKSKTWHLLITTDLSLGFNKLIEFYQIRWSIEVFFKDAKQHLKLGSCQSNCFDAQIADITISMLQYIMLIYFKRINYQQSFGELFAKISSELVEIDLLTGLLEILKELIELLCQVAGIDFIEFQKNAMQDDKILTKFIDLFPEKQLSEAA